MYAQDNNSLPVWIILSPAHHHISINSQPFLVGIVSIHHHNQPILTGPRLPNGLWSLPLQHDQTQHHANTLFTPKTQQQLVQWLHAAAFSPSPSTFLDAIQCNFFATWPGLTPDIVQRYLTPSDATVKGHLDKQ